MEAHVRPAGNSWHQRAYQRAGPIFVWSVWAAMTAATILFIRHYSRNIPYMDDFALVSVMTSHRPANFRWMWTQHNEHRPVVSRLILGSLFRLVGPDIRVGMYFNVGLLSSAAASMLLLVRNLRGRTSVMDIVLPLSILNIGQAETLLISFAMNLVLTTWISCELIRLAGAADSRAGWPLVAKFGLWLVLLPLCGGSGLVLVPPLIVWLAGFSIWGWWCGRRPGRVSRSVGVGLAIACLAVVCLYMRGYVKPAHHRPAPSLAAVASTTLECLSMTVCPNVPDVWRVAALIVVLVVAATLLRLASAAVRHPEDRPRALALIAIILSMLIPAVAVGVSRSFFGAGGGLASRYVTISAPLLCAIYVAWLAFGPTPARLAVHTILLTLVCLVIPANIKFGLQLGEKRRQAFLTVERSLRTGVPSSELMSKVCPALYPDRKVASNCFKMLRDARVGNFKYFVDDRVTEVP